MICNAEQNPAAKHLSAKNPKPLFFEMPPKMRFQIFYELCSLVLMVISCQLFGLPLQVTQLCCALPCFFVHLDKLKCICYIQTTHSVQATPLSKQH